MEYISVTVPEFLIYLGAAIIGHGFQVPSRAVSFTVSLPSAPSSSLFYSLKVENSRHPHAARSLEDFGKLAAGTPVLTSQRF